MKSKRYLWFPLSAILLALLLGAAPVVAGTINFNNITPPGPNPLTIDGVTFSAIDLRVIPDSLATVPPNVLFGQFQLDNLSSGEVYFPIITMDFDQPQFYVTFHEIATTILVSTTGYVDAIVAQAFDQQGNLLDQDRLFLNSFFYEYNFRGDRRVILSADGIAKVTFGALVYNPAEFFGEFSTEIDNLAFCPCPFDPVPVPASALLLGSGLLGILGVTRKLKN